MQLLSSLIPNVLSRLPEFGKAINDTLIMLALSGIFVFLLGLILGLVLVVTKPGGILENKPLFQVVDKLVSLFRSIPFIILLALVMPLSRLIAGTTIGVTGAIVPLVLGAIPFYARQVESAVSEVDGGLIEAAQAIGASPLAIIFDVYLRESVAYLARATTITLISLLNLTAMAGVVGAGGLGDFAIRYGHDRNQFDVTIVCVIVLVLMVALIQLVGDTIARSAALRATGAGSATAAGGASSAEAAAAEAAGTAAEKDAAEPAQAAAPAPKQKSAYQKARRQTVAALVSAALCTAALVLVSLGFQGQFSLDSLGGARQNASQAGGAQPQERTKIKVGVVGSDADVWGPAVQSLKAEGIDVELVEFSDYVTPNRALDAGDIDLNAFQHQAYLDTEIKEHGYKLKPIAYTFISPINLYSHKITSLDELKDGDTIALPNDVTNEGRALKVLEHAGFITLDPAAGDIPALKDVRSTRVKVTFKELAANTIPSALDDVTAAFVNGSYAISYKLPINDAVLTETVFSNKNYWNLIAARANELEDPERKAVLQKVVDAYHSEGTQDVYKTTFGGYFVAVGWDENLLP